MDGSWGNVALHPKRALAGLANVMQPVEDSRAHHPDLRQRRGFAGQATWSWRKANHFHWMPVRNLHGYQKESRLWDDAYHGWWNDAVNGNSALQSGELRRIYEEVATLTDKHRSACSSTWSSFYDFVCLLAQTHRTGTGAQFPPSGCCTYPSKRTSASVSSVQEECWGKACSLPMASWLAAHGH